ncbi:MAG TPA: alpha/beta hydrolase [Bryobacteraceae bacterium]|nr:alpha/beta hydrolase [Bryobacteraceae bacterium]
MRISVSGLTLMLVCLHAQPKRPQTPQAPFPYQSQEVSVPSKAAGVTLACTLSVPQGEGPHPAMVLVTGSGPQDRDETVFGHRPFLVIADYLARHGVGTLRCDDRGTGKSTGRFLGATTADFSLDAEGAFNYLSNRPEFKKVGIAGQSEGAVIAPMVASRRPAVAFVVMLAGVGVRGDIVGYSQAAAIQRARGVPEEAIQRNLKMQQTLIALASSGATEGEMRRQVREKFATTPDSERIILLLKDPWHRWFIDYDPEPMLEKVKCPVLVLNGDLDLQVVADLNVPAIEAAFHKGGNQHVTVRRFPKLNHLFQTAITGSPDEYPQIEETIAPVVLETIVNWLDQTAR